MRILSVPLFLNCISSLCFSAEAMNVVFFLVDDLGYHDLSLTGSSVYETPNVDQLSKEGVFLKQAYAAYPRCVPSRFAMMTGVHPSRAEGRGEQVGNMRSEYETLAEALKESGYRTFFAGKWHLGKSADHYPEGQGFDINVGGGSAGAPGSYFPPYGSFKNLTGPNLLEGEEGEYLNDLLTNKTVDFIEANKTEPFLVYLSHYAVHTPIEGKPEVVERYQRKMDGMSFAGEDFEVNRDGRERRHQNNAGYAAMVESMDESLGRVVAALKTAGVYDKTIIIFTSDHGGLSNSGPMNERPLATSNAPLRAGKGHMYEGGIRIPVIIRWPGETEAGTIVDFPITGMDYYPSLLDMLGLPLRPEAHVDGVSFVPGLRGEPDFNADRSFFWYSDRGRRKSTGDFNAAVIRRGKFKLLEFFNEKRLELYNLALDPGEERNLAGELPEKVDALYAELKSWKAEMNVKDREQN